MEDPARRLPLGMFVLLLASLWLPATALGMQPAFDSELNDPPLERSVFVGQPIDGDVARVLSMLEGSWKTTAASGDGEGEASLWMHTMPFETDLLGRAVYVEVHADGTPWRPMQQLIFRVYRFGDELRLRTYEFREPDRARVLANLWLAPKHIPVDTIRADELIPTMDLTLERTNGGYEGQTPVAYPTGEYASVERRVSMTIRPDRLVSTETLYGVDGQPLPSRHDSERRWERAQLPATVEVGEDGLVVIELEPGRTDGPPTDEGDILFINYEGWRTDGVLFDSTLTGGLALRTVYPPRVIGGFRHGIEPMVEGMRRKLIIPPELGYGQAAVQGIPPGSTLIFQIHILKIEQSPAMPMEDRVKRPDRP